MRSTKRLANVFAAAAAVAVLTSGVLTGCSVDQTSTMPEFTIEGSRPYEFTSLEQLAGISSAIVVATPTGKEHTEPLPDGYGAKDSAPTQYIEMRIESVESGELKADVIDLVSPGIDAKSGKIGLIEGGPFLLFITPAMFGPDDPAGGYVVVGGPAGVFASTSANSGFLRVDNSSAQLPSKVSLEGLPRITQTEAELLRKGPQ